MKVCIKGALRSGTLWQKCLARKRSKRSADFRNCYHRQERTSPKGKANLSDISFQTFCHNSIEHNVIMPMSSDKILQYRQPPPSPGHHPPGKITFPLGHEDQGRLQRFKSGPRGDIIGFPQSTWKGAFGTRDTKRWPLNLLG